LGVLRKRGVDAEGKPIFTQKKVDLMLGVDIAKVCLSGYVDKIIIV